MIKDSRNRARVIFWQGVYKYLIRDLKVKGTPFVRPKAKVRVVPELQKTRQTIRSMRRSKKMTQADLAREMGVKQQFISKIESGNQNFSVATLEKIERVLGPVKYENAPKADGQYLSSRSSTGHGGHGSFLALKRISHKV